MLYQLSYFRKNIPYQRPLFRPRRVCFRIRILEESRLQSALHPFFEWEVMDSNHRRRTPADLQSAPFGHSGNFPLLSTCPTSNNFRFTSGSSAAARIRCPPQLRFRPLRLHEPMEGFEPTTS